MPHPLLTVHGNVVKVSKMKKCILCNGNIQIGRWTDPFPALLDSKGEILLDLGKHNSPIKGYVCVSCNYFVTVLDDYSDLKVKAEFKNKENTCFNCGKLLRDGVWANYLPSFKILKENTYLIQNLIAAKPIGGDMKIASKYCPDCALFVNTNSEYKQIYNARSKEEVNKHIVSEAARQVLFTKYMMKGAIAFGLIGLIVSVILFLTELSGPDLSEKAMNVFRGGISFMAAGMILGALVGIIMFRINMRRLK